MADSNIKASDFIHTIELYYNILLEKFYTTQETLRQARVEAQQATTKAYEAQKILDNHVIEPTKHDTITITNDLSNHSVSAQANTIIPDLQEQIRNLQTQNELLEQKYQKTYQSLQKEMLKVDTIQMELELLQRERDIALRKQSLSSEQKQFLVKLEYENYRINETIERIDYISDTLKSILSDTSESDKFNISDKIHISELQ